MNKGDFIWYKPNMSDGDQAPFGPDPVKSMIVGFEPNGCLTLILFVPHQNCIRFLWTVPANTNPTSFDEGTYMQTI